MAKKRKSSPEPEPELNVTDLCRALAIHNIGGKPPARSTIYRAIPRGLPVARYKGFATPVFLLSQVLSWWNGDR